MRKNKLLFCDPVSKETLDQITKKPRYFILHLKEVLYMSHKPKNDKFKPKEPERVRPRLKETTSQKKLTSNTLHFKRKSPEHSPNQDYFNSYPERVPNQDKSSSQRSAKRVRTETVEYQRLHDKLSSIETRINEMKANIQKKRESKQKKDEDRSRRKLQLR